MNRFPYFRWMGAAVLASIALVLWWGAADPPAQPTEDYVVRETTNHPLEMPDKISAALAVNAAAPVAVLPPREERVLPMRQDVRWQEPVPEQTFASFRDWTGRYLAAASVEEKAALSAEGLALAETRRHELADLIDQNPRRALELAVPVSLRRQLPEEVLAQLEERIAGRGDLQVIAAVAAPGRALRVRPVERLVTMRDGREFAAFTYGQRELVPTRPDISVQGIALDGKLALAELPGRIMEPVEVADLGAAADGAVCPTSGKITATTPEEVVVDWDGAAHTFFCGPGHALDELIAASGDEATAGSGGGGVIAQSANTEGPKKLLIIRVDFPDAAGQVVGDDTLTSLINNMAAHWAEMSFGKMSWAAIGAGSNFTPTLRLPNGHASYTNLGAMLAAARTAATAAGFNYTNYTHEVVVTGDKPDVGFGGVAYVGARGSWLANSQWNLGVCSHEVGHNFGLNHSGFWDTTDGTVIGAGAAVEYGNPFDQMGGASSSRDAHFGARQKNYLDWIADADVVKITTDGSTTTRIRAFDKTAAAGAKAIAVDRTGTTNDYWMEYRQTYTDTNLWMRDGVLLNWGDVTINNMKPVLLDWAPGTSSKDDCPVLIGRTFSDAAAGIHLTPLLRGADANGVSWIDVRVNRGAFAGNRKPTVTVAATNLNPAVSTGVTFTATATDPDGDVLGYFWDWGDGTFTANNTASATKTWSAAGTKTVRCFVTDMKGMTTTGQLLVQVGTSTTFFIQGLVKTTAGVPVENAVVRASSTQTDTTDTEGYFAITGLAAGSYTLSATKVGLTIQPDTVFFANPVVVGPNKQNINFTAPPGAPYFATMKAGLLDAGSNTGAVILPVSDADTPLPSLTLTAVSSNPAIIPHASITFGTVGTTIRTVTAAAAATVSGPVNITITATDPEGGTASYVYPVTVNARPVLTIPSGRSTVENMPLEIDLRTVVSDDLTPLGRIAFDLSRVRNGTATLLPDGYTARFTPSADYHGPASFQLVARDQSLSSRMLFFYDFEPPDLATDAKATDLSNFNRTGTLETAGSGGEYAYASSVPPRMAPYATKSLSLTEATTGAARVRRTLAATDLNYNDADWSFSAWVKRVSRDTDDIVLHLGNGDGFGTDAELQLYFPAASDVLKVGKYGAAGLEKEAIGPALPVGTWHHVTLVYDRTGTNVGTLSLFVNGFAYGTVASVAMNVSQTASLCLGGAATTTSGLPAWFDGQIEDATLQSGISGRPEIWGMARLGTQHYHGLTATGTVALTVTGTNQPPTISAPPEVYLPVNSNQIAIPIQLGDAETEARSLTVSVASSNPALLPVSGIVPSAAPAAWVVGDIGAVGAAGSTLEDHGTFIIGGAGADIGPAAGDEFRWVRQPLGAEAEIVARVVSLDFTHPDAKAGVMMRDSTSVTSPYALAAVTPGSGVTFQLRATEASAAVVSATINGVAAPCWVRLVRSAGNFTAYYAEDNNGSVGVWQALGTPQPIAFPSTANAFGPAVTSRVDATVCTAVFDQLGGTVKRGGERTVAFTPAAGASGTATVTLTVQDGTSSTQRTFDVVVEGAPPSLSTWSAATAGSLPWSVGTHWSTGTPPANSRFSSISFFNGQTLAAGSITSNNDTLAGHAMNGLTLAGTGPASGSTTVNLTGNALVFRQETLRAPVVDLAALSGTGLTYQVTAPVVLEAPTTFQGSGTGTFLFSGGISGAGSLTKIGASRLILAGTNTWAGGTTLQGGVLQIGNDGAMGTLPPGGVVNHGTLRFDRTGTLAVPGVISGTGGILLDCPINNGTIVLSGANSFTGGVTITSGALRITNSSALGTGSKTISLFNGTAGNPQLRLDGSGGAITLPSTIKFTTSNVNGAIYNEAGNNILQGDFTLTGGGGDTRIVVSAGSLGLQGNIAPNTTSRALQLAGAGNGISSGIISNGTGGQSLAVTKSDNGTWTLSGVNTFSGLTTVSLGTLRLGHSSALGDTLGATTISTGGILDLNGHPVVGEVTTLNGGSLVNTSATAASIDNVILAAPSQVAGTGALTINGALSGAFTLTKAGSNTLTLTAATTHAVTTVTAGQLILSGSLGGRATVTGGTLLGTGSISGDLTVTGGVHAPGTSPGVQSIAGQYGLLPGGTLQVELTGTTVGTQYDQVRITGAASTVTLGGRLDLVAVPALPVSSTFTILDNAGTAPVSGTFANLPQGTAFFEDGQWWRISYTAGTGNDITLTRIAPMPWQTWQASQFGTQVNDAAVSGDLADPDSDGLANLLEYGLGGNPTTTGTALPQIGMPGGRLALTFFRNTAHSDLTLTVQGADSPAGPWTDLARSTGGTAFVSLGGAVAETGAGAVRTVEVRDLFLVTDSAHPRRVLRVKVVRAP